MCSFSLLQHICLPHWDHCIQWSCAWVSCHQYRGGRLLRRLPVHPPGMVRSLSQLDPHIRQTLIITDYLVLKSSSLNVLLFLVINRINTPRKQGGLGEMKIPLLSDLTHQISKDYGVYLEDQGHTLRYSFTFTFMAIMKVLWANFYATLSALVVNKRR